jgi:hypothetical protein
MIKQEGAEMNSGSSPRQLPSSKLPNQLEMLRRLVNLQYPNERVHGETPILQEMQDEFTLKARNMTKNFWPELWEEEWRALENLRIVRHLLRLFWCERDERKRDWYIHRCRFFYRQLQIEREFRQQREEAWQKVIDGNEKSDRENGRIAVSWVYAQMDRALDNPPDGNPFENALYSLQERALWASRAPRCCKRKDKGCPRPYFFASKKSRKFCSTECAQANAQQIKRESWHSHKKEWRTQ